MKRNDNFFLEMNSKELTVAVRPFDQVKDATCERQQNF